MKLIALHTIHGADTTPVVDDKGKPVKDSRGRDKAIRIEEIIVKPGEEFDSETLGIKDDEIAHLIVTGAVKRKMKEVPDDAPSPVPVPLVPVAKNTAPKGPASGQTVAPDPSAVAAGTATSRS